MSSPSKLIGAEELTAYERWELPTVTEGVEHPHTTGLGVNMDDSPNLLTAAQIEELQQQAYQEGYQSGFSQGREDGVQAGRDEMHAAATHLAEALSALSTPFEELDAEVEQQLVALAFSVARQIIRRELRTDPGQVIAVVREALGVLPAAARTIRVHLHPEDARLMREAITLGDDADSAWQIVDDPVLTRGGCLIETEFSTVDATVEKRINAVMAQVLGSERGHERAVADQRSPSTPVEQTRVPVGDEPGEGHGDEH